MKAVINQLCIYSPKENTGGLGIFIQSQKCLLDIWALLFPWSGECDKKKSRECDKEKLIMLSARS